MVATQTESRDPRAVGIDQRDPVEALGLLLDGQIAAANALRNSLRAIARLAGAAAHVMRSGGRLFYAAAGSSGLMALADALELPGTFGIAQDRVVILFAGGISALEDMVGGVEDDREQAARDVLSHHITAKDLLIALSASGTTPYALAAVETAKARGAKTAGIANNDGSPLLTSTDLPVLLATPPEILAGSTRMGAGTAQKIALNMMSTLMGIELGHVHDGLMVNVRADNEKLLRRSQAIVAAISGCSEAQAAIHLDLAGGAVKSAVLLACGARNRLQAETLLERAGHMLRPALSELDRAKSAA
ncbi:MAG: N-acetylmuramic acid 6-phosphate etherase [Rhizobiaceae bacterium]